MPILLVFCLVMMAFYFKYAIYAGIIMLAFGSLINYLTAILTERREADVLGKKDSRMERVVELLNIKTIKLNSWCDTFRERVRSARNIELKSQLVKNFVYGFTFLLMFLL